MKMAPAWRIFATQARVGQRQLEVLRRDAVGDGAGLVDVAHLDQRARGFQRARDHRLARHGRQQRAIDARTRSM
jgi:hypothetical protein